MLRDSIEKAYNTHSPNLMRFAQQIASPALIYDVDQLVLIASILTRELSAFEIHFAVKASYNPTILLETLYGIIRTYKGTISVNGYNIKDAPDSFFDKHFSYAFLPPYTVAGTLGDNLSLENIQPGKKDLINNFINSLRLDQAIHATEKQRDYSFGQKQRISFIRALAKSADVYLLDEITNGVDKPIKEQMLSFIQDLAKSSIVIIVSHDPEVLSMSGNIISIEANGKVYQQSS